jgi:hypothetical protein
MEAFKQVRRYLCVLIAPAILGTLAIAQQPAGAAKRAAAPGTVDGLVTDSSLVPLADATVSIAGSSIQLVTGANGRFRMVRVPSGEYVVVVRHLGFAPVWAALRVDEADTLRLSFALERMASELDTVKVTGKRSSVRMAEFEERRKLGFGQFMTLDQIEKRNSVYGTELVRTFSSINVRPVAGRAGSRPLYVAMSLRPGGAGNGSMKGGGLVCPLKVVIDGVQMPNPFNLDDLPPPRDLVAIEVYSGPATVPLRFKGADTSCGVILVWTKDGS